MDRKLVYDYLQGFDLSIQNYFDLKKFIKFCEKYLKSRLICLDLTFWEFILESSDSHQAVQTIHYKT